MFYFFILFLALPIYIESDILKSYKQENLKQYETRPLDLIQLFINDCPVIVEAGGHYGTDTIKMAKKWPSGSIYTFEPNPHAYEKLVKKTQKLKNIYPHKEALSNINGIAPFYVCYGPNSDNKLFELSSSLLPPCVWVSSHYQGPVINVECTKLKDWCEDNVIRKIDFLWLALEGMELQVLSEEPKILESVKAIYTQTNFHEFREGMTLFKDLKRFLQDQGFQLLVHWPIAENSKGHAIFVKHTYETFPNPRDIDY